MIYGIFFKVIKYNIFKGLPAVSPKTHLCVNGGVKLQIS